MNFLIRSQYWLFGAKPNNQNNNNAQNNRHQVSDNSKHVLTPAYLQHRTLATFSAQGSSGCSNSLILQFFKVAQKDLEGKQFRCKILENGCMIKKSLQNICLCQDIVDSAKEI